MLGSTQCWPLQQDEATTDSDGGFLLRRPGAVVHLSKPGFRPVSYVVRPDVPSVRIVMPPAEELLDVRSCAQPGSEHKSIGWGKYGLHFSVPKRAVKILGGEPDVDCVRYVTKPKGARSYLELWFGPYAMNPEPDDDQFIESANFVQRDVVRNNSVVGLDSWGETSTGGSWRQTSVFLEGARYRNADKDSALLFNKIIDSLCWTDSPNDRNH